MSFISHVYKLWSLYTQVNCKNKQTNKQNNNNIKNTKKIKTQKKYPKGIKHFLTYIFDYTHPILKDLSDKNMSGPTYCFIQWV